MTKAFQRAVTTSELGEVLDGDGVWINNRTRLNPTDRFLGKCNDCILPIAREAGHNFGSVLNIRCPECARPLKLARIIAVWTDESCDGSCMSATRADCECSCGGANHGCAWLGMHPGRIEEVPGSDLEIYRHRIRSLREAAASRSEEAAERKAVEHQEWVDFNAAVVMGLRRHAASDRSGVLLDMRNKVNDGLRLTPREIARAKTLLTAVAG